MLKFNMQNCIVSEGCKEGVCACAQLAFFMYHWYTSQPHRKQKVGLCCHLNY